MRGGVALEQSFVCFFEEKKIPERISMLAHYLHSEVLEQHEGKRHLERSCLPSCNPVKAPLSKRLCCFLRAYCSEKKSVCCLPVIFEFCAIF